MIEKKWRVALRDSGQASEERRGKSKSLAAKTSLGRTGYFLYFVEGRKDNPEAQRARRFAEKKWKSKDARNK
jgi:hypothetical protein